MTALLRFDTEESAGRQKTESRPPDKINLSLEAYGRVEV